MAGPKGYPPPRQSPLAYIAAMHFLDQAKIFVKPGAGGPGAVSFRREKSVESAHRTAAIERVAP